MISSRQAASALRASRDLQGVSETLTLTLRRVFAINLPASAGLAFLGEPIVRLLFEHGQFTPEHTRATAAALGAYAVGLTAYSAVKVLVPVFYAFGNTRVPVISSFVAVGATIALNLALIGPMGFRGLALGTSVAALINAIFLLGALRGILGGKGLVVNFGSLARSFGTSNRSSSCTCRSIFDFSFFFSKSL